MQVTLAQGEARSKEVIGKGELSRIAQLGLAEAAVTSQKVSAYRDPRLYALNVFADEFSKSVQPLVPSRLFISNAGESQGGGSVLETLLSLILSEKAGINLHENTGSSKPMGGFYPAIHRQWLSWEWRPLEGGDARHPPCKGGIPLNQRSGPSHSAFRLSDRSLAPAGRRRVDKTLSNLYPVSPYATYFPISSAGWCRFGVTTYRLCNRKGGHWGHLSCDGLQTARSVQGKSETFYLDTKPVCDGGRPTANGCSG
jgi:hypothetical protein